MSRLTGRGLGTSGVGGSSPGSPGSPGCGGAVQRRTSSTSSFRVAGADFGSEIAVISSSRSTRVFATGNSLRAPPAPSPKTNSNWSPVWRESPVPSTKSSERFSRSCGVRSEGRRRRTFSSLKSQRAVRSRAVSKVSDASSADAGTLWLREPRGISTFCASARGSRSRVYARCVAAATPGRGRCPTSRPSSTRERCSSAVRM